LEQSPALMSNIAQTCEAFFAKETS